MACATSICSVARRYTRRSGSGLRDLPAAEHIPRDLTPAAVFPKSLLAARQGEKPGIRVSQLVVESAAIDAAGVYARLGTRPEGLTSLEASARLAEHGSRSRPVTRGRAR